MQLFQQFHRRLPLMKRQLVFTACSLLCVIACLAAALVLWNTSAQNNSTSSVNQDTTTLSANAAQQIQALINEKNSRTPAQRKISSQLLYQVKAARKQSIANGVQTLKLGVEVDAKGLAKVDIKARVTKELLARIEALGGEILYSSTRYNAVRARLPLDKLETLAAHTDVKSIRPADRFKTQTAPGDTKKNGSVDAPRVAPSTLVTPNQKPPLGARVDFAERAASVREQLAKALPGLPAAKIARANASAAIAAVGSVTSEGDTAHRAREARNFFGVNGAGIKIGVLSDSVDFLENSQDSGDLPDDVTVLPGQAGEGSGEGTAMLEIIHDLAPGADLFFATAFNGQASFADNIRALREAGCDIIVDDVFYFAEAPFQDDIIAQAVNDVTADGALYFSSAGNQGNFNDGTSSVWEGDFKDGGSIALLPGGTLHDFGTNNISNRVDSPSSIFLLFWSDALGASGNDYDLFFLNENFTEVQAASTDIQDGDDDPIEGFGFFFPIQPSNSRLVILRNDGAQARALHLNAFGGELAFSTAGQTHGHSAAVDAYSVAAVNVAFANGGAFTGGVTNPVELYSSDGKRRVFYRANGTPYKSGNVLFKTNGGRTRQKPDIAAADGVVTSLPSGSGLNPFFGTSAAAPHAAAIAALIKSAKPSLSPSSIRNVFKATSLDIEATGVDRDSGYGIPDAFAALQNIGASPSPVLELGNVAATPVEGDGDAFIEPGESARLVVQLTNIGGATALDVSATLTTSTPGVTITSGTSSYPDIGSNGQSAVGNTPFTFTLDESADCGLRIEFTLTVSYVGNLSPQTFTFSIQTGQPDNDVSRISYTGPAVAIPDSDEDGVDIPINVSGLSNISDFNFSIDGSDCSATAGSTTVGVDHTFVGDLIFKLTSPNGTTVTLISNPGSGAFGSSGNNFCNTVLDDEGDNPSIQAINSSGMPPLGPPYTGTFKPANPLAAFDGEDPNGTWTLNVSDSFFGDEGNVRAFSLIFTGFECTSPLAAKINFQPANAPIPQGYLADTGATFGNRGNGFSYGWDADNSNSTADRNASNSPDQRFDTLTHTQRFGRRKWEIAVPNGMYRVRLVAGDPSFTNSRYRFDVENVLTVDGRPGSALNSRWVEGTKVVTVSDGKLTVSNGSGASNNKLCFIEITGLQ